MMKHGFVTFHIVDESPWPLYMSFGAFAMMSSIVEFTVFLSLNLWKVLLVLSFIILSFSGWVRDVSYEGLMLGQHTLSVQNGLKMGFVLFILSEVMFFLTFFWSLFYFSVGPSVSMGGWPPAGICSVNPLGVPLLGTLLLMSSGVSVTWGHYSMLSDSKSQTLSALLVTLMLGITFSVLQLMEYMESSFSISDSSYGSIFYMSTGFHGLHVLVGSIFLSVCLVRTLFNQVSKYHHVGLELAIWYWHFVDVVWLFLYVCMYLWGW
uniref:Cytochrome c oxidase subunit 3 n=1 Tax=Myrsidea sp. ADS-2020 TaxID=2794901 RepID=A0A7T1M8H0_9NEOP|nr:cytochrome c oxidase subunit 3 [Myrsidea sp. ADS-2020]